MSFRIASRGAKSAAACIAPVLLGLGLAGCAAAPFQGAWVTRLPRGEAATMLAGRLDRLTVNAASALTSELDGRSRVSRAALLRAAPATGYIVDVLRAQHFEVVRWPAHVRAPLRVWIGDGSRVPGWHDNFESIVKSAVAEWCLVGLPLRVEFVPDSARAEVRVSWVEHFGEDVSGRTTWQYDEGGNIRSSRTTLSTRRGNGRGRSDVQVRAIALHEIGHALGLQHSINDPTSIMAPHVNVLELSDADRITVRLLYSLPAGLLR